MRAFVFIPGIRSDPDDENGWTDRAVRLIAEDNKKGHTNDLAFRQEYFATALFRRLNINDVVDRAWKLTEDLALSGLEPVLVGHSNGAEVICRVLKRLRGQVRSIHLIAGACEDNFKKNDLNDALEQAKVGHIFCYCSNNDTVLKNWGMKSRLFNWIGLGYGLLGLRGPIDVTEKDEVHMRVHTYFDDRQDHSTWLNQYFETTMERIRGAA